MTTIWTITIDWDRNANFTDTNDDVTMSVVSAKWSLGFHTPYQDIADDSTLELVLNNEDRRFSPDYAAGPLFGKLLPQCPVRITSQSQLLDNDGLPVLDNNGDPILLDARTHWLGWVDVIAPAPGQFGERTVTVVANGPMQFLKAAEANIPLQEHKRTDEVVALLLQQVVMPPALSSAWLIGIPGHSEIGQTTFIADTEADSLLEQGALTLTIAADNWINHGGPNDVTQNNFDVYHAISDVTAAEHGRFFFDREGRAVFWNRHHPQIEQPVAASFDDDMVGMDYVYGGSDQLKNEIVVVCHPRTISADADQVLWELGDAVIKVRQGEQRTLTLNFQDEFGNRVAGKDMTLDTLEFDHGMALATLEDTATRTELHLDNTGGSEDAVIKTCVIKGRKITDFDQLEVKATDAAGIVYYGKRTLRINLPSVDELDYADVIARYELRRRKTPVGMVQALTLLSHGTDAVGEGNPLHEIHGHQLALTIGDRISVGETQSGHGSDYYVIGEAHKLTMGATKLESTLYLEPTPQVDPAQPTVPAYPWLIGVPGYSEIGQTTVIGF